MNLLARFLLVGIEHLESYKHKVHAFFLRNSSSLSLYEGSRSRLFQLEVRLIHHDLHAL